MGEQVDLPIDDVLPDIVSSLREQPRLVIQAPPGAGKTTRVPPAILDAGLADHGRILLLEPRRVAARAVSRRIADERGARLGGEVGYQVRFDRRVSDDTRLIVMTEGILTRQIQSDPLLEDVGVVVLDEFHERSIHTDLAIAFLKEVQQVRDDLLVVVMSATIAGEQVASYLDSPFVESEGRLYPVDLDYVDEEPDDIDVAVYRAVRRVLDDPEDDGGDILVFLPGAWTIRRCASALSEFADRLDVCPLYGALSPREQDRAIESGPRRKVILSTNIAETSLTIEGVTTVIDSGFVKQAVASEAKGFDRLETRRISMASARQRAGRAGRVRPGRAIRLWPRPLEFRMPDFDEPEIRRVDVTSPVLEVVAWSGSDPRDFDWFESPSDASLSRATRLLRSLDAVDAEGFRITDTGRRLLEMPTHPRIGRILLEGNARGCGRTMAGVAAVIGEDDFVTRVSRDAPPVESDALVRAEMLSEVASGRTTAARSLGLEVNVGKARRVKKVRGQLDRYAESDAAFGEDEPLKAVLAGFPDRICFHQVEDKYALAGGSAVVLGYDSMVRHGDVLVALEIFGETSAGRRGASYGIVRMASRVELDWVLEAFPERVKDEVYVDFDAERERVMARRRRSFDGVQLEEEVVSVREEADPADVARILAEAASGDLVGAFGLDEEEEQFLARWRCLAGWMPELELPDLDFEEDSDLLRQLCWGKRSFSELRRVDLPAALKGYLDHRQIEALEREAPERLRVPSGSRIRLTYEVGEPPVLAVRLQEVFGWTETPTVAKGRVTVLMHLLAPNFRPAQVTRDLESFWENTYPEVRKELRARYPKHPWPEDPLTADAVYK